MRVLASGLVVFIAATSNAAAFFVPSGSAVQPKRSASSCDARKTIMKMSADGEMEGLASAASGEFESLSLPARPGRPLKVAIAGGGVGGHDKC